MSKLQPQDPRRTPVSDATVSGAFRVALARQDEEDRRVRQEVCIITQDESVDEEDMVDDDGFQDDRGIWEVTHV